MREPVLSTLEPVVSPERELGLCFLLSSFRVGVPRLRLIFSQNVPTVNGNSNNVRDDFHRAVAIGTGAHGILHNTHSVPPRSNYAE